MSELKDATREGLRPKVARCDDRAGHHVIWADRNGEIHITLLPRGTVPTNFRVAEGDVAVRLETCVAGNGNVGLEASLDDEHLDRLLKILKAHWTPEARDRYVDSFG